MHKHKALVTGGSRGIGAEIAIALRCGGVEVITPSRSELDLLDPVSIDRYIEAHHDDGIDILVNNAGINPIAALEAVSAEDWARTLQVNLTAPFRLIQGFSPGMKSAGWGVWSTSARSGPSPRRGAGLLFVGQVGPDRPDPDDGPGACASRGPGQCGLPGVRRDRAHPGEQYAGAACGDPGDNPGREARPARRDRPVRGVPLLNG